MTEADAILEMIRGMRHELIAEENAMPWRRWFLFRWLLPYYAGERDGRIAMLAFLERRIMSAQLERATGFYNGPPYLHEGVEVS